MAREFSAGDLIPGLPEAAAELCLLRLPFPCPASLPSVSSTWNRILTDPSFFSTKSRLSLAKPYLLALADDRIGRKIQYQCLDPVSKNWCPLPPMPNLDVDMFGEGSMASCVDKEKGEMYIFVGKSKYYVMVYSVATNSWRIGNHSMKPRGIFLTSAAIGEKAFAFSIDRPETTMISPNSVQVQCYDPLLGSLVDMAETTFGFPCCDAVVIGKKIHVTESLEWSINLTQREGRVYDSELNTWNDMPIGLINGWTLPVVATLGTNLFMLESGDNDKAKVYDHVTDSWMQVKGSGIPIVLSGPYTVAADDENGKIYVVGRGLNVAIATLIEVERNNWEIKWVVVKGPDGFSNLCPRDSQILYA